MMPEHEIHHRGQLYTMLGMLNVPTPPIYGMTAARCRQRSRSLKYESKAEPSYLNSEI